MSNLKLSESLKDFYLISGRVQGDDDDTVRIVQASDIGNATEKFLENLKGGIDPEDYDDFGDGDGPNVYLIINNSLEDAVNHRIIAENSRRYLDSNVLRNLYLISGRISGDDDDMVHIVEADDIDSAVKAFEEAMQEEEGELRCYDEREMRELEVVIVNKESLLSAIHERLIDNSKNYAPTDDPSPSL